MGKIRLDKYLADMGLGTRTEVKKDIKKGRISVNQEIIKSPEYKIDIQTDVVLADGKEIAYEKMVYYMLNKPQGVVSATEDRRDRTVLELIQEKKRKDLFPVGRLDKDTEGLLLITNDGELAHNLLSPKKHISKTYRVLTKEKITDRQLTSLQNGVDIGEKNLTQEAVVEKIDEKEILLTIYEGKFHQVKRMLKAVDNEVVYLERLKMGQLSLDDTLDRGDFRKLTQEEILVLKSGK